MRKSASSSPKQFLWSIEEEQEGCQSHTIEEQICFNVSHRAPKQRQFSFANVWDAFFAELKLQVPRCAPCDSSRDERIARRTIKSCVLCFECCLPDYIYKVFSSIPISTMPIRNFRNEFYVKRIIMRFEWGPNHARCVRVSRQIQGSVVHKTKHGARRAFSGVEAIKMRRESIALDSNRSAAQLWILRRMEVLSEILRLRCGSLISLRWACFLDGVFAALLWRNTAAKLK